MNRLRFHSSKNVKGEGLQNVPQVSYITLLKKNWLVDLLPTGVIVIQLPSTSISFRLSNSILWLLLPATCSSCMSPTNLFAYHVAEHTSFSLLNSISEDTIPSATAQILQTLHPTAVCKRFEEENLVCPANLRKGLVTVGALDNIDYNPSATTAKGSFHGTGITIFQLPSHSNGGIVRDPIVIEESPSRKLSLPDEYVNVPAISCKTDQLSIPQLACGDEAACLLEDSRADEEKWFQHGIHLLKKDILTKRGLHILGCISCFSRLQSTRSSSCYFFATLIL